MFKSKIDRDGISQQEITLICGKNVNMKITLILKDNVIFCVDGLRENDYLIKELAALKNI